MAKRQSLSSFSPKPQEADGGKVEAVVATGVEPREPRKGVKYPHVSVYLQPQEIRTLKLLSIETDTKISDICATAVREWLERNGHARTGKLTAKA